MTATTEFLVPRSIPMIFSPGTQAFRSSSVSRLAAPEASGLLSGVVSRLRVVEAGWLF
jgi:hypothetical protein